MPIQPSAALLALTLLMASAAVIPAADAPTTSATVEVPVLDGDWWQVADQKPDLGQWSSPNEDACDFTVFPAADGTWQIIGCVRGSAWPTGERVFHRWEARSLEDRDWTPKGVFRTPDVALGQVATIQAPHGFVSEGIWYLFYNAGCGFGKPTRQGNAAYVMTSRDGKSFADLPGADGKPWQFAMGRDINLFHDDDGTWYAYYAGKAPADASAEEKRLGAMAYRRAPSLAGPWSEETPLGMGGNPESPFMVKHQGRYYLWQQLTVYISDRPDRFPKDPAWQMTPATKYAPEVIEHEGKWYIAGYGRGIFMSRMRWEPRSPEQMALWQQQDLPQLRAEQARKLKAFEDSRAKPAAPKP